MQLESTIDFLERLKAKHGAETDYQIHKALGISKSTISGWRTGRYTMDDDAALMFARELDLHPAYVMACAHAERSKTPETTSVWHDIAKNYAAFYALVFIGFLGGALPL